MRFILVDRVDALVPGESISGVKNLALSEEVFAEHFPDHPLYPGTLLIEALAQLGGCLVECSFHQRSPETRRAVLVQIERAKFHGPCRPGDHIALRCNLVSELEGAAQVEAHAFVQQQRAVEATLNFRLVQVQAESVHQQRRALYQTWMRAWKPEFPIR